jgi:two-component system sensor histidine kinase VanS
MMRRSIKRRIALSFILLMVLTLAAVSLVQWLWLGRYYADRKQDTLVESWNMINGNGDTVIGNDFRRFCETNSLTYAVFSPSLNYVVVSNSADSSGLAGRILGRLLGKEEENTQVLRQSGQYQIIQIYDRFISMDYLELWGTLDNGNYYIVRCPLTSIEDSVAQSNQFYVYVGGTMVLISAVIIWLLASRIVKPIRELTAISKRMAALDFDARYTSGGEDEIGELGHNFNQMSDKLELAISELKSANARLQKDIEEKTQIDEMRREFLANVSHELKTPIALIQGYAEGLKDNISDDAESRDFYCSVIMDESAKMNTLVRQLLDLNQLEFGYEKLNMERFDLAELIRGVIQSSHILIEQKEAKILFRQTEPIHVWGDEFKIEEVVTNYLTNALNHLEGEKVIEITCREQEGKVITTVFNSGKPIPEEELDKIWIKFYKVDKARTREYGGSGIGLSIVRAIMDAHGQKCWAQNYANGVAFSFTLEGK